MSSTFTNGRGQDLQSYRFLPKNGVVKAVLHYHHGLGDYAQRNKPLYEVLAARSIAVFAFDVHGHGASEPLERRGRFAIRDFSHVVDDTILHLDTVVRPYIAATCPGAPLFLMGSSMGAAASVLAACRPECGDIAGLVLNAAAIDARRTFVQRLQEPLAPLVRVVAPNLELVASFPPEKFVRDPEELARRADDTMLNKGGLKVCTACAMLQAFAEIRAAEGRLAVPVLAVHGADDSVCPLQFVERLLANCASTDKRLEVLPDARHDTLHDYGNDAVKEMIVQWVLERVE